MDATELYNIALNTYGWSQQFVVACEELSELQKELCKYIRGKGNFDHITEELADAMIMIEQVITFLECGEEVVKWRDAKHIRLRNALKEAGHAED